MRVLFSLAFVCALIVCPAFVGAVGLPAGTSIQLVAMADYIDSFNQARSADPATVTLRVVQVAGVAIETSQSASSAVPGQAAYIPMRVVNTGNGPDSFNLTVSSARGWQVALIYDTNADGIHQSSEQWAITSTGTMIADGYCPCFARITVPPTATTGDTVTVTARSTFNPAQGGATTILEAPPPDRTATAITVQASPHTPIALQPVTLTGRISPAGAFPITVTITDPVGAASSNNLTSAADGAFQSVFTPSRSGVYQVTAAFAGAGLYSPSSTALSISASRAPSSIALLCSPGSPSTNDSITISGILTPAQQSTILMTATAPDGGVTQAQVPSDAQGAFTWNTRFDSAGVWKIAASYAGSAAYASTTKELSVNVTDPDLTRHVVEITSGPTASPSTVVSAGAAQCAVTASDSQSHALVYRWSDGGAGGTFIPSADVARPTYTARSNITGRDVVVTLTCTVTCSQDSQVSDTRSTTLVIQPVAAAPRVLSVSPSDGKSCVALDTPIVIQFDKQMDRAATQQAILVPPGLLLPEYEWSTDSKALTIRHQGFFGETEYTGIIGVGATDSVGTPLAQQYSWTFTTTHYLAFEPAEVSVQPGATLSTPPIVLNDPTLPDTVTLFVTIPEGFAVDTSIRGAALACVEPGDDVGEFSADWDAGAREIMITAVIISPAMGAEIVRSITLGAPDASRCAALLINGCSGLTVRVGASAPGDFNADGVVNINDASLFVQQWSRWHKTPQPVFSLEVDGPYDLAPRTAGVWPDWAPIGDGIINISDASAFIDCWIAAQRAAQSAQSLARAASGPALPAGTVVRDEGDRLVVTITSAPDGRFDSRVVIPADAAFDARVDASGNLANVQRGDGVGTFFFTEFDPAARAVCVTGSAAGQAPYTIAVIAIQR